MSTDKNYDVKEKRKLNEISTDDISNLDKRVRKLEELLLPRETAFNRNVLNFGASNPLKPFSFINPSNSTSTSDRNFLNFMTLNPGKPFSFIINPSNLTSTSKSSNSDQKKNYNKAFVIYIETIEKFWIQEKKFTCDLELIKLVKEKLATADSWPRLTTIEDGLMCVAKYSGDGLYHRARIVSHNNNETIVFFVDCGNTEQSTDLRVITEDLANVKPFARKCSLVKPEGVEKWPDNVDEEFKKLSDIRSTVFLLDILKEGETCFVKLGMREYDVAQELIKLCNENNKATEVEQSAKERLSSISHENPVGSTQLSFCKICLYESPNKFWIQDDLSQLQFVKEKMKYAKYLEKFIDFKKDDLVAIEYFKVWYRAKVNCIMYNMINVTLIDFGISMMVLSPFKVNKLPENLIKIPPLATCCLLEQPQIFQDWPKEACDKFSELYKKKLKLQVEVLISDYNAFDCNYKIVKLYLKGKNVKDIILNNEPFLLL